MQRDIVEPGSPRDWLRHAVSDLELTRKNDSPLILLEELCFHAQQAAEKAIKAVLVLRSIQFPKTHNVKILTDLVPPEISDQTLFDEISILTDYAVTARYPGNIEDISSQDYSDAIDLAGKTVEWARRIVSPGES